MSGGGVTIANVVPTGRTIMGPDPIGNAFVQVTFWAAQMYCGRIGTHVMAAMAAA